MRSPLPSLVDSSPAADLVAEHRKLTQLHTEATNRHRRLTEHRQRAADDDAQARAAALRTGKPDPGDKHTSKHQKETDAAARDIETTRTAVAQVWRELRTRLARPDAQAWADSLTRSSHDAAQRAAAALAEAADAFAEIQSATGAAVWAKQALEHCRGEKRAGHPVRWPAGVPRGDLIRVNIGSYAMTPHDVLQLLIAAAHEPPSDI